MKTSRASTVLLTSALALMGQAQAEAGDHPATCAVIEAATTAMVVEAGGAGPSFPKDIRPFDERTRFDADLAPHLKAFDLTPAERSDLLLRSKGHRHGGFAPDCAWTGKPLSIREEEMTMTSAFSRPLFSTDGRLAVFGWSFYSPGVWAHGDICLARRGGKDWKAVCQASWLR